MELKDQVCSLESARKLKELGVKQESLFYWNEDETELGGSSFRIESYQLHPENSIYESFSAFTVAELGDLLPSHVQGNKLRQFKLFGDRCEIVYGVEPVFIENTEAEARSKMLIYLLENKLI